MPNYDTEMLARELLSAYEMGKMIDVRPSEHPGFDLDAAYAVEARLKQLREGVSKLMTPVQHETAIPWDTPLTLDSLLTEIWEDERPSCPKRSTIGGFFLHTLEDPWQTYVEFHITKMGCSFCAANLQDFQEQNRHDPAPLRNRILQSTVGFLSRPTS